jgi:hypothetical protein
VQHTHTRTVCRTLRVREYELDYLFRVCAHFVSYTILIVSSSRTAFSPVFPKITCECSSTKVML